MVGQKTMDVSGKKVGWTPLKGGESFRIRGVAASSYAAATCVNATSTIAAATCVNVKSDVLVP